MGMVKKVFFKDPEIGAETSTGLTSMAMLVITRWYHLFKT